VDPSSRDSRQQGPQHLAVPEDIHRSYSVTSGCPLVLKLKTAALCPWKMVHVTGIRHFTALKNIQTGAIICRQDALG